MSAHQPDSGGRRFDGSRFRFPWRRLSELSVLTVGWEAAFALVAAAASVPLWVVSRPPLQDLPQHLAAIRILVDYAEPALQFSEYFTVELGRTQYLAYYLAARVLALVVDVAVANNLLLTASIVGLPYAMRSLLRSLGRDERYALFVIPLAWNAHLILGFFNFVAAIPLALWGIAIAVRLRDNWSLPRAGALAAIGIATFYTHVVPFAFWGLGAASVAVGGDIRQTLRRWLPLLPAAVCAGVWSGLTPAGRSTLSAAALSSGAAQPKFSPASASFREATSWLTDILPSEVDDRLFVAWMLCVLVSLVLGLQRQPGAQPEHLASPGCTWRVAMLSPLAALAYFVAPASYDWIWPIHARFPVLALIFFVLVLPRLSKVAAVGMAALMMSISVASSLAITNAFQRHQEEEFGEFDRALEAIPRGKRVAGLVWDRGSRWVRFSPFIHSAAWYQAERGGAVMFTFADFPQSPIRFRPQNRPPAVGPRWEWMPERVRLRDLDWYDYVICRGGPGRIASSRGHWRPTFRSRRWSVWRKHSEADH